MHMTATRNLPLFGALALGLSGLAVFAGPVAAQGSPPASAVAQRMAPTYADLATLADRADLVLRATVRKQARVKDERAPGLAPDHARLYIEAETDALVAGTVPVGESLRYLVDVPLDAKGKVPKLKKQTVLLFARPVPGQPAELQLVDPRAQFAWSQELADRVRPILAQLVASDTPPVVTGIEDALSIAGNLVGESETQLFLETQNGAPASITILRRPGQEPRYGVSWSELVDQSAKAVERDTLGWYRLACGLPDALPESANLARDPEARQRAERDYAWLLDQLGTCNRNRT